MIIIRWINQGESRGGIGTKNGLGKWLRSIPRNIMQRGRWEVA